jgi:hypothetical protein
MSPCGEWRATVMIALIKASATSTSALIAE